MMITKILQRVFLLIFIVVPVSVAADDDEYSALIVFGDSLSDNGNLAAQPGFSFLSAPPFAGGLTNGDPKDENFAVEVLADELDLQLLPAFAVPGGTNFAVAGARAVTDGMFFNLPEQLAAFIPGTFAVAPSDALYVIFIGNNDVFEAIFAGPNTGAIIQNAVDGIEFAIRTLAGHGATDFLVANVPDVAATPAFLGFTLATEVSQAFNIELADRLEILEDELGLRIFEFDTFGFLNELLANADSLGFSNTQQSCIALLASGGCDFDEFVFFDDVHPTAAAHELAGEAMSDLVEGDDDDDDDDEDDDD